MANATITVLEADGVTQTDVKTLDVGRQAAAASKSLATCTEDKAVLDAIAASLVTIDGRVDGLETLVTSTNTKLDTAITALQIIDNMSLTAVPTDPFGADADSASATGSISAKLRAIATALGVTALDLGSGTGGSRTLRVAVDSGQLGSEYETVVASATAQVLGPTGAAGDLISKVVVIPESTSPGNVLLLDNATSITLFAGGADSVSNLVPFTIDLGMISVSGAWKITTGANVHVIGIGNFT